MIETPRREINPRGVFMSGTDLPVATVRAISPNARVRRIFNNGVRSLCMAVAVAWVALRASAAVPANLSDAEVQQPPGNERIAGLVDQAAKSGWRELQPVLRDAAFRAYRAERLAAAEGWLNLYRWANLLGQTEAEFVPRWIREVNDARVGHRNLPTTFATSAAPLGGRLPREVQAKLIGNRAFSEEFFATLTPVDFVPEVFRILTALHRSDPRNFAEYTSLALAIAVVYDLPPPPDWPHAQVSATALSRRWPKPEETFAYFVKADQTGRTYQRLKRLGADDLKFVVDIAASFDELRWSQQIVDYSLGQFAKTYGMVRYRQDRVKNNVSVWPETTYTLMRILSQGGICADQAYFASQAGKARGVPTLVFAGGGRDGRHAWFGYLDGNQKWQLDAGRYAEQRFITGIARDPQTWRELSDHDLQFLTERFRALPTFRQSLIHAAFAAEYLAQGDTAAAARVARKATGYDRRNLEAWETLFAALEKQNAAPKVVEAAAREAAVAFMRYPDLEARFTSRLVVCLRARGETSLADAEERKQARKYLSERGDLSIQQAAQILERSIATQPIAEQIRAYHSVLENFGHGAGMVFFDRIVVGFALHLSQQGKKTEAIQAIARARQTLKAEPNSQLDAELRQLTEMVKR